MKALNIQETYKWIEKNTVYMQDTTLLDFQCLELAVKHGVLFEIDKEHFIPKHLTAFDSRYFVTEVYKVDSETVEREQLQYPYRLKATLAKACGEYKENVIKYHSNIDLAIEL